jgi:hypothetical protein
MKLGKSFVLSASRPSFVDGGGWSSKVHNRAQSAASRGGSEIPDT